MEREALSAMPCVYHGLHSVIPHAGFGVLTGSCVRHIRSACHSALRALVIGMGQPCLKTLPIWPYQGEMAGASMVRWGARSGWVLLEENRGGFERIKRILPQLERTSITEEELNTAQLNAPT